MILPKSGRWYHFFQDWKRIVSNLYPYTLTAGALISLLWLGDILRFSNLGEPSKGVGPEYKVDAGIVALAGGLVFARLGFVFLHWEYYRTHLGEIVWLWEGGLSWAGGAVGGVIALAGYTLITRRPFWPLADSLALPLGILSLSAWSGCLLDGCAYGRQLSSGSGFLPAPDLFGSELVRWPTQAVGALFSLLVIAMLLWLSTKALPAGVQACISVTLVALGALGLSFARSDPALMIANYRVDTLAAAVIAVPGLVGLVFRMRRH